MIKLALPLNRSLSALWRDREKTLNCSKEIILLRRVSYNEQRWKDTDA